MIHERIIQPDVKFVLDRDVVIREAVVANDVAEESFDTWLGRPWAETVEGIGHKDLANLIAGAAQQEVSPFFQLTQRFPSGLVVPVEYMAMHLRDGCLMAVGRDVRTVAQLQSRLAAAQQSMERGYWRLREAEDRYRVLFEASSEAIAVLRADDYSIAEANPAAIAAMGYVSGQPQEIAGRSFLDIVTPTDRALVSTTLSRAKLRGKAPRVAVRLGPGQVSWFMRVSELELEQGQFLLLRLLPANEMRSAEHIVRGRVAADDIVTQSPVGIIATDDKGVVLEANPAFIDLVQVDGSDAVVGSSLTKWLRPPGGDSKMLFDILQRDRIVRIFPTTICGDMGDQKAAEISAVLDGRGDDGVCILLIHETTPSAGSADQNARLGQLLSSITEQLGKTRLKELVDRAVGLVERHFIEAALTETGGNRTAAAKMLGLSRQSLYMKLARYEMNDGEDET